jgi:DNA-binding response OmpR family regulator
MSSSGGSASEAGGRLVLVVEDEPTIAEAIAARLRAEGLRTLVASDGPTAVRLAHEHRPDLLVLDVMLPGFDGLEVCRRVQAERPVPILMVTARDAETDLLVGLGVGADDYLTKPFSMRELIARAHALLRRVDRITAAVRVRDTTTTIAMTLPAKMPARSSPPDDAACGERTLEIDKDERRVRVDGAEVHLTPTEFDLLLCLARRPRAVLTRDQLLAEVWDWIDASGTRTVDSHVKALRRKIGAEWIRTVHGVGYALEAPG